MPFHFLLHRPPIPILFFHLLLWFPRALLINFSVLLFPALCTLILTSGTWTEQHSICSLASGSVKKTVEWIMSWKPKGKMTWKGFFTRLSMASLKLILFFGPKLKQWFLMCLCSQREISNLSFRVIAPSSSQASLREWKVFASTRLYYPRGVAPQDHLQTANTLPSLWTMKRKYCLERELALWSADWVRLAPLQLQLMFSWVPGMRHVGYGWGKHLESLDKWDSELV